MKEQVDQEHINYIKRLSRLRSICHDEIRQHEYFHERNFLCEEFFIFEIPSIYNSSKYFKEENYKYFQDKWDAKISILEESGKFYFIVNYSVVKKSERLEFFKVIDQDFISFFSSTLRLVEDFYSLFEKPFSLDTTSLFIDRFFFSRQFEDIQFPFKMFIPYLNIIEKIGVTLDLNSISDSHEDFFGISLDDRVKFIPEIQWRLEKFKHEYLSHGIRLNYPEGDLWMKKTISSLNTHNYYIFVNNCAHILDYLISEDLRPNLISKLGKISLKDMIIRSKIWINKMKKEVLIEKSGDCAKVLKLGNLSIMRLLTTHALDRESAFLCHCVGRGSYDHVLQDKDRQIYSVRNEKNEPIATIEVNGMDVVQIQGFHNELPHEMTKDIIRKLIIKDNLSVHNPRDSDFLNSIRRK